MPAGTDSLAIERLASALNDVGNQKPAPKAGEVGSRDHYAGGSNAAVAPPMLDLAPRAMTHWRRASAICSSWKRPPPRPCKDPTGSGLPKFTVMRHNFAIRRSRGSASKVPAIYAGTAGAPLEQKLADPGEIDTSQPAPRQRSSYCQGVEISDMVGRYYERSRSGQALEPPSVQSEHSSQD
jgi:hypothetical protein